MKETAKELGTLNKDSYEPAYIQITNIIKQRIAEGVFRPGNRLPPESKLCKSFNVSPMTVRRSINLLLDQGIVTTIQGGGTFVRSIAFEEMAFRLEEFHQLFKDNKKTRVKLLEVKIERADEITALKLDIAEGDRAILLRRLILDEIDPVLYHKEYLIYDPNRPIVEDEMEVTSLHGLFSGTGDSNLKRGEMSIEAMVLNKRLAEILNAPENSPAFRLEHIFYDFDDRPISWGRFLCRGDRFRFTSQIGFSEMND